MLYVMESGKKKILDIASRVIQSEENANGIVALLEYVQV